MSPATVADRYRRWFDYERDSHAKVVTALEGVPADLRSSSGFQKAVDLLAHIVAARRLWLHRLGLAAEPPREVFPQGRPLERVVGDLERMEASWAAYLAGVDDGELARLFEYTSLEGHPFRNSVEDVLAQLFGHSWYHRGQIAQLVRALGCNPAVTDLVYWTRQSVPERA